MPVLTRFKDLHGCLVPRKKQNHPDNRVVMAPGKAQPMRNIRAIIQRGPIMNWPNQLEITGLPAIAYAVIDRAAQDAANGSPTAGAWLLSDTAQAYADLARLDDGFLGELASMALERLCYGS
jgi:hypothetical protein